MNQNRGLSETFYLREEILELIKKRKMTINSLAKKIKKQKAVKITFANTGVQCSDLILEHLDLEPVLEREIQQERLNHQQHLDN